MMLAPTLAAARAALPPEGANPPWGGPAVDCVAPTLEGVAPTLGTACPSLPPEGANPPLGRPGGGVVLPPTSPAVFTLNKLGRPGWWGVWCSGIKEEAVGRGTAAAPNATPVWSATRPR